MERKNQNGHLGIMQRRFGNVAFSKGSSDDPEIGSANAISKRSKMPERNNQMQHLGITLQRFPSPLSCKKYSDENQIASEEVLLKLKTIISGTQ